MPGTYEQSTGRVYDGEGKYLWTGYSGHGEGKNNPLLQHVHNVGPIPQGLWRMLPPGERESTGWSIEFVPEPGTETFGRTHLLCHGERVGAPPGDWSHGCIVKSPRALRDLLYARCPDHLLRVVAGYVPAPEVEQ